LLPCLACEKPRKARSPSLRLHATCRAALLKQVAVEFIELTSDISTEEVIDE
jgi:hypothetical protein